MTTPDYTAKNIVTLEFPLAMRTRPEMFINERDPLRIINEVLDNAIDECLAGFCTEVNVMVNVKTQRVSIKDNGRGIPPDLTDQGISGITAVATKMFSGGKFDRQAYAVSSGLHGLGLSVANALANEMTIFVSRNEVLYQQDFKQGLAVSEVSQQSSNINWRGTKVEFTPDEEIFGATKIDINRLRSRIKQQTLLLPGLLISLQVDDKPIEYYKHDQAGLLDLLNEMITELEDTQTLIEPFSIVGEEAHYKLTTSIVWTSGTTEWVKSFVNCLPTVDGGTHQTAFRKILAEVLNRMPQAVGKAYSINDLRAGCVVALHYQTPDVAFGSQTKEKYTVPCEPKIRQLMESQLETYFTTNTEVVQTIIDRAVQLRQLRTQSKKAQQALSKVQVGSLRKKTKADVYGLVDCTSTKASECELLLLEGQSAGGNLRTARDSKTQAVLPLRGKVLNAARAQITTLLRNEDIMKIINSIAAGVLEDCDPARSRYGKIKILTDADADGAHIAATLLTLFHYTMRPLLEAGMIYVAVPYLYGAKKQKKFKWAESLEDLQKQCGDLKSWIVTRYKGIGEMNSEDVELVYTKNPHAWLQVQTSEVDGNVVVALMGNDSGARKLLLGDALAEVDVEEL